MSWHHRLPAVTVPLLLVLFCISRTTAVPVGCFPPNALDLNTLEEVGADTTKLPTTEEECEEACYTAKSPKPLAVFSAGTCQCTSVIPDVFAKIGLVNCVEVPDSTTNAAGKKNVTGAASGYLLLYAHHVKNEYCTVAPVPFFSNWWQDNTGKRINFTDGLTEYNRKLNALHFRLTKNAGSIKVFTVDSWKYGYYTTKMIPFGPGIGAVTTFYTTSSYADEDQAPENREPWDEITLSFPSSYPRQFPESLGARARVRAAIGGVWTKNYKDGNGTDETLMTADDLKKLTGDEDFDAFSGLQWYGINWQPKNLDWFVNGVNVDRIPSTRHPIASQMSRLALGVWRPQGYSCWEFGGCNNSEPYEAYFSEVRRIVCGSKKLIDTYNALNYNPSPPPPPNPPPFPPPRPPNPPGTPAPPKRGVTIGTTPGADQNLTAGPATAISDILPTTAASAAQVSQQLSLLLAMCTAFMAAALQIVHVL